MWLEPAIREGRLYLRKEQAELIRQLEMFPNGDLVDQADALSGAVHNSRPYMGVEEMMADKQEHEARVMAHTAMTAGASRAYGGYA